MKSMKIKSLVACLSFLILFLLMIHPASAMTAGNSASSGDSLRHDLAQSSAASNLVGRKIFAGSNEAKGGTATFAVFILVGLVGIKMAEYLFHDSALKKDGFLFP